MGALPLAEPVAVMEADDPRMVDTLDVMEDGESLWLARATPRAWLGQGKKITVKNAPSHQYLVFELHPSRQSV